MRGVGGGKVRYDVGKTVLVLTSLKKQTIQIIILLGSQFF